MKRAWILAGVCAAVMLARALPQTEVLPAATTGTRYIFVTNYIYIYPKATNWIYVSVTNWPQEITVHDLYLPSPKSWLTN